MSVIPWLNDYPGRTFKKPIKKKVARKPFKKPYVPAYQYIDLPTPLDVPKLVWENIVDDFNQSLRISYKELTSPRIVADQTEFEQQPGALSIGITLDPEKYKDKNLWQAVWDVNAKKWVTSVLSWGDFDIAAEQRGFWGPLLRGKNGVKDSGGNPFLGLLEKDTTAVGEVYRGIDEVRYTTHHVLKGSIGFDAIKDTPYEVLAKDIEDWVRFGMSLGDRRGKWSKLQVDWLNAVVSDMEISGVALGPGAQRFMDDVVKVRSKNAWLFNGGVPRTDGFSVASTLSAPLANPLASVASEADLIREGLDPKLDRVLFPDGFGGVDFTAAQKFYEKKMLLLGGQNNWLENKYLFSNDYTPFSIEWRTARKKYIELQKHIKNLQEEIKEDCDRLLAEAADKARDLTTTYGVDKRLFEWQKIVKFRESVFATQDFLQATFDKSSFFRTFVYMGKLSRHMPGWMGEWGSRIKYLTPGFYIGGYLDIIDQKWLGFTAKGIKGDTVGNANKKLLKRFTNKVYVPFREGVEMALDAKGFTGIWGLKKALDDLVKAGTIDASQRALLLKDTITGRLGFTLDNLVTAGRLQAADVAAYRNFRASATYAKLTTPQTIKGLFGRPRTVAKLVDEDRLHEFYDLLKGKLVIEDSMYVGPMVRVGRWADHMQNALFNKVFGQGKMRAFADMYSDLVKGGGTKFGIRFQASKLGQALAASSKKYLGMGAGTVTKNVLGKILGSSFTKVFGSLLGAAGGIVTGVVAWVGAKLLQDLWNLIRGKPVKETKKAIGALFKAIIFTVGGCCAIPMLGLFLLITIVGGIFAIPQSSVVTTASTAVAVTKTGTLNGNTLTYKVNIANLSGHEVKVSFRDSLNVVSADCAQTPRIFSSGASYGELVYALDGGTAEAVEQNNMSKFLSGFGGDTRYLLASNASAEFTAIIQNIPAGQNISFVDTLSYTVTGDAITGSPQGTVNAVTTIGTGGCAANITGGLADISQKLANCLTKAPTSPYLYSVLNETCLQGSGLMSNPTCANAVQTYAPGYNVTCVTFVNIALACANRPIVACNATQWPTNSGGTPARGDVLVFTNGPYITPECPSGCGHVGVVSSVETDIDPVGNEFSVIKFIGANMSGIEYVLNFDGTGTLVGGLSGGFVYKGALNTDGTYPVNCTP